MALTFNIFLGEFREVKVGALLFVEIKQFKGYLPFIFKLKHHLFHLQDKKKLKKDFVD